MYKPRPLPPAYSTYVHEGFAFVLSLVHVLHVPCDMFPKAEEICKIPSVLKDLSEKFRSKNVDKFKIQVISFLGKAFT